MRASRARVERELSERMRSAGTDEARGSEAAAWAVVRAAHASAEPAPAWRRGRRRWAAPRVLLATLLAGALALTPAGAKVGDWIGGTRDAPSPGTMLPVPGRLLVTNGSGAWVVDHDLDTRWLGPYASADWSARARFVIAAGRDRLAALTSAGQVRWTLARPQVNRPAWSGGDGFRVAYRSGDALRIVAGDGSGDRLLAAATAPATPAWRPGPPGEHVLAFATKDGRVVVRDVDGTAATDVTRVRGRGPAVRAIAWAGPDRLLVMRRHALTVTDGQGRFVRTIGSPGSGVFTHLATAPDDERARPAAERGAQRINGRGVAFVRIDPTTGTSGVWTVALGPRATPAERRPRMRFAGAAAFGGLAFSHDGRWLAFDWPAADQWVFVGAGRRPRLATVRGVDRLLEPGVRRPSGPAPAPYESYGIGGWAR